jgi:hypothetical protein
LPGPIALGGRPRGQTGSEGGGAGRGYCQEEWLCESRRVCCTLMGTVDGSFPGAITSSVISTATPSARAVTFCAIGNAYGGLPSNLIFPNGSFPFSYRSRDTRFSPLAHRGARVIGTDMLKRTAFEMPFTSTDAKSHSTGLRVLVAVVCAGAPDDLLSQQRPLGSRIAAS